MFNEYLYHEGENPDPDVNNCGNCRNMVKGNCRIIGNEEWSEEYCEDHDPR